MYDLIFVDQYLFRINGLQVTAQIRELLESFEQESGNKLKVYICLTTSVSVAPFKNKCEEYKLDSCLLKPMFKAVL